MIVVSVVKSRPIVGGIYLASEQHLSAYGLLIAGRGAEAVKMP